MILITNRIFKRLIQKIEFDQHTNAPSSSISSILRNKLYDYDLLWRWDDANHYACAKYPDYINNLERFFKCRLKLFSEYCTKKIL